MHADIQMVLERDPAARSGWEVALLYPGMHAIWLYRVAHALWQRKCISWHVSFPRSAVY
jgi:serine O-acetyltransferase